MIMSASVEPQKEVSVESPVSSISQVIDESAARLQEDLGKNQTTKRPRGRPRKLKPDLKQENKASPTQPLEESPKVDLKPFLAVGISMPFGIWAEKTKVPQLSLSEAEAFGLAAQADDLLREYFPTLADSKEGKLSVFAVSFATVCIAKYMILMEVKKNQVEIKKQSDKKEPAEQKPSSSQENAPQVQIFEGFQKEEAQGLQ